MAKTTGWEDQVFVEVGRGVRQRRVSSVPFICADARTNMTDPNHVLADAITNTTVTKPIFIAPCAGTVLKISANALVWPNSNAGTIALDVLKAVIGAGNESLLASTINIEDGARTADTAVHGTLNTTAGRLNLLEGQLVYASVAISNNALTARSDALTFTVEWRPTER